MSEKIINQGQKRLLGIFAHPDDEVFSAGGTLARAAAMGVETMVVSATRGEAGQIRDANAATRRTLGQVREQELHRAAEKLGVKHVVFLDHTDGTLQTVDPVLLTSQLTEIIRDFQPDTIITFGPDGAYGHPDHTAISDATTQAVRVAGDAHYFPEQLAAGLSPHQPNRFYYSHFPRKQRLLTDRLGHWLVELCRRFQGTADFTQALSLFSEEATMLGYISDFVETSWFPAGFYVVEQGEPADKLYLILSGQAEVRREDDDGTLHTLAQIGPGHFFGEEGLVYHRPRNAHVVAIEDVTCLVFSPNAPTKFAGRGAGAQMTENLPESTDPEQIFSDEAISVDVAEYVPQKVAALAAHHTQFPLKPDMLPLSIIREMFGQEYFVRIHLPAAVNISQQVERPETMSG